jgi:hypothetical protein
MAVVYTVVDGARAHEKVAAISPDLAAGSNELKA